MKTLGKIVLGAWLGLAVLVRAGIGKKAENSVGEYKNKEQKLEERIKTIGELYRYEESEYQLRGTAPDPNYVRPVFIYKKDLMNIEKPTAYDYIAFFKKNREKFLKEDDYVSFF